MTTTLEDLFSTAKTATQAADIALGKAVREAERTRSDLTDLLLAVSRKRTLTQYDEAALREFVEKPYLVRALGDGEWELSIPRFIGLRAGWPIRHEGAYTVYRVSHFTQMLSPAPDWLARELEIKASKFHAVLTGNTLVVEQGEAAEFAEKYAGLVKRNGDSIVFSVRPASRFELLRRIIREEGFVPFQPSPIPQRLLRNPHAFIAQDESGAAVFGLRPYQANDFQRFLDTGAVSVFAYPQTGKSFLALMAGARVSGPKLILAPRRTLVQQWQDRLAMYLTPLAAAEVTVATYAGARPHLKREWSLVVFDEAHHLPANMAIDMAANIQAVSRMALSATPFREDGESEIIPALGGFPVGVDWPVSAAQRPSVTVWVVKSEKEKLARLRGLCAEPVSGKTLVFTFRLDIGHKAAKMLGVPFVEGKTKKPLDVIRDHETVVVSSVGNEGLSFPVRRVVELDFLFGSRMEAGQRLGRLAYEVVGEKTPGQHHVLMTEEELARYGKRLFVYEQWGLEIDVRRSGFESTSPTKAVRRSRRGFGPARRSVRRAVAALPNDPAPTIREDEVGRALAVPGIYAKVETARKTTGPRVAPYVGKVFRFCWSAALTTTEMVEAQGITDTATRSRYNSAANALVRVGLLTRDADGRYRVAQAEIDRLRALDSIRNPSARGGP